MKRSAILTIIVLFCLPFLCKGELLSFDSDYAKGEFENGKIRMPYRFLSPGQLNEGDKYPLVVFLHGAGERGTDNEKQLLHGGSLFSNPSTIDKYPAYVIFPQCKEKSWTGNINARNFMPGAPLQSESETEKTLVALIENFCNTHPVDKSRIYIVGISMGGIATYDLVCRHPDLFAAAVPICGAVNPERLIGMKDVNFLIFHGEEDEEVPMICSREAYKALSASGTKVDYVEFSGIGHECWSAAFNYPTLLPWLFSQSKSATGKKEYCSVE